ncbi:PREDICTED: uncharacterized protein LOC106813442 [Priapulus caudatus]|uniref:Uncharacterized protein LOC106813442 n=1 Tax=Priapulus caudatus TaxID=37621 RepID=A0ABM1ELI7_PRICU|nr:PREDICTED: uncharacterized protein LOC106813442 [Priapulus caudatus]
MIRNGKNDAKRKQNNNHNGHDGSRQQQQRERGASTRSGSNAKSNVVPEREISKPRAQPNGEQSTVRSTASNTAHTRKTPDASHGVEKRGQSSEEGCGPSVAAQRSQPQLQPPTTGAWAVPYTSVVNAVRDTTVPDNHLEAVVMSHPSQMSNSSQQNIKEVRKIVEEEGRSARNLITWNVPIEEVTNEARVEGLDPIGKRAVTMFCV